ncbi:hypothetical protein AAY473_004745 [Plecturocebus cupreus]
MTIFSQIKMLRSPHTQQFSPHTVFPHLRPSCVPGNGPPHPGILCFGVAPTRLELPDPGAVRGGRFAQALPGSAAQAAGGYRPGPPLSSGGWRGECNWGFAEVSEGPSPSHSRNRDTLNLVQRGARALPHPLSWDARGKALPEPPCARVPAGAGVSFSFFTVFFYGFPASVFLLDLGSKLSIFAPEAALQLLAFLRTLTLGLCIRMHLGVPSAPGPPSPLVAQPSLQVCAQGCAAPPLNWRSERSDGPLPSPPPHDTWGPVLTLGAATLSRAALQSPMYPLDSRASEWGLPEPNVGERPSPGNESRHAKSAAQTGSRNSRARGQTRNGGRGGQQG